MLDYRQVRRFIVKPALIDLGLWSQSAETLCLGTAMVESQLVYIDQKDKTDKPGPAYGVCQMEKLTHDDLWSTTLTRDKVLRQRVLSMAVPLLFGQLHPPATELWFNLRYAFAMCRVFYWRVPASLPGEDDAMGMALYHKKYYNTYLGDTKVEDSVKRFQYAIKMSKEVLSA